MTKLKRFYLLPIPNSWESPLAAWVINHVLCSFKDFWEMEAFLGQIASQAGIFCFGARYNQKQQQRVIVASLLNIVISSGSSAATACC